MSRFICTKENPWIKGKGPVAHPDAVYKHDVYDQTANHDDYMVYRCPNCDLTFNVTIPN